MFFKKRKIQEDSRRQLEGQLEALLEGVLAVGHDGVVLQVGREILRVIRRTPGAEELLKDNIHFYFLLKVDMYL